MVWSDNDRGTNCDHCSRDLMTGVPAGERKQGGVTRRHWTHQVALRCIYCIVTLLYRYRPFNTRHIYSQTSPQVGVSNSGGGGVVI